MDAQSWTTLGVGILTLVYAAGAGILAYMFRQNQREHDALDRKVDNLDDKVDSVQTHLGSQDALLSGMSATVNERIKSTDQRFDSIEGQLKRGIARMDATGSKVEGIAEALARIEGRLGNGNVGRPTSAG